MLDTSTSLDFPPPPAPASLDTPETKYPLDPDRPAAPPPLALSASIAFRHSGWRLRRQQVFQALEDAGIGDKRRARFAECGWGGWVWQDRQDPHVYRVTANCCHDRWCLPCGAARGRIIARNLGEIVKGKRIRFITLTLAHRDQPLKDSLTQLAKHFGRLRRSRSWTSAVTGGAVFLEIKRNRSRTGWHPHLHIIAEGKYLHHATLKATWHKITGDSYIVDIRAVKSQDDLIRYVTKYVSKPLDNSIFESPETIVQAIQAMHGRRTCTTFGSWRGQDLTKQEDDTDWISVAPLGELIQQAKLGDEGARYVLSKLSVEALYTRTPDT